MRFEGGFALSLFVLLWAFEERMALCLFVTIQIHKRLIWSFFHVEGKKKKAQKAQQCGFCVDFSVLSVCVKIEVFLWMWQYKGSEQQSSLLWYNSIPSHLSLFWPQIRQDYPLNLSISISGGKETNKDSLSSGEWSGKSSKLESPGGCSGEL